MNSFNGLPISGISCDVVIKVVYEVVVFEFLGLCGQDVIDHILEGNFLNVWVLAHLEDLVAHVILSEDMSAQGFHEWINILFDNTGTNSFLVRY